MRWFVVKTERAEEYPVSRRLEARGFEAYLPMERSITIRRSERYLVEKPFFPGFVLVRFDLAYSRWEQINAVRGVERIMTLQGREEPAPIPDGAVDEIRDYWQRHFANVSLDMFNRKKGEPLFKAGDVVRIKSGPFFGHNGTVTAPAHHRVRALVSLLGRETPVELGVEQVELVEAGGEAA